MGKKPYKGAKGNRTEKTTVRMTPKVQKLLKALGISSGDLLEEIVMLKAQQKGIPIPAE